MNKYTLDELIERANKFTRRGDFLKGDACAYQAARRYGVLDLVCMHMVNPRRRSIEDLKEHASRYTSLADFIHNDKTAYCCAYKQGVLKEVCEGLAKACKRDWTIEELQARASRYEHRSDWYKYDKRGYHAARRRGLLDVVCAHMTKPRIPFEVLRQTALKYKTVKEFRLNDRAAYDTAWRYGELPAVTAGLERKFFRRKNGE